MRDYAPIATPEELKHDYQEEIENFDPDSDILEGYSVNFDVVIGKCPNCSDLIYEGQGNTVHDWCYEDYRQYVIQDANKWLLNQ